MGLLSGLNKFVSNVGSGLGDVVNDPLKAGRYVAGTTAGVVAPGYGTLWGKNGWMAQGAQGEGAKLGLGIDLAAAAAAAGGAGGVQLPGLGGSAAGTAGGASGAFVPGVDAMGIGAESAGIGGGTAAASGGGLLSGLSQLGGGSAVKGALGATMLASGLANGLNSQSPPGVPDYKGAAIATSAGNRYSTVGPTGTTTWSLRPGADPNNPQPGDYIQSTQLSQGQQQLYDQGVGNRLQAGLVGGQQLKDLGGGQQGAQDALYHRLTSYYDTRFGNQENQLRSRLQNQGLVEGSEAWNNAMSDFNQTKNTAYADAADRAVIGADTTQNNAVSRLAQIMSMSQGQTPTAPSGGAGPDLLTATNQAYQAQLGNTNAANAQSNQSIQQLLQAAGLLYGVGP